MHIIKRSVLSIKRKLGKTFLLLGLVFLLSSLIAGALMIDQAINSTADHLKQRMPIITELSIGIEVTEFELITSELVREIGALPYVRAFDYPIRVSALSQFHYHVPELEPGVTTNHEFGFGFEEINSSFRLQGVSHPEVIHVTYGLFDLAEGRVFNSLEMQPLGEGVPTPVLIPSVVAELNGLSVGSVFNLYDPLLTPPENANIPEGGFVGLTWEEIWYHPYNVMKLIPFEFVVIGILDLNYHAAPHLDSFFLQQVVYNTFFIPNWKAQRLRENSFEHEVRYHEIFASEESYFNEELFWSVGAFWILENAEQLEPFREAAEQILPEFYTIVDFNHIFDPLQDAMAGIGIITNQALIFAIGATLIMLSLLITLYLRDRRHELGIYLALGEKKIKIISQILMEVLAVAVIGISLAIFSGNILATHVSRELLLNEIVDGWSAPFRSEVPSGIEFVGLGRELRADELAELFDVSLNTQTIMIFYAVGLASVIVSTAVPIIYILELKPKEILTQGKIG